ncbi:hypothetical protein [Pelagimonas sp.]|uniref:hypothetical protein n=1 Tax=Pelagimonas sp. TaxID=2073170 RepID=UPI003D6B1405
MRFAPHLPGYTTAKTVKLCLQNPVKSRWVKGISNHTNGPPTVVVDSGMSECLFLAPMRQKLVFWSQDATGDFAISVLATVDLRGKLGEVYYLRWAQEAPIEDPAPTVFAPITSAPITSGQ